ncbi:MAG TPA: hypothetical protein VJC18_01285, partial [bacterium]|nr:hypothetical protein [bacterium]
TAPSELWNINAGKFSIGLNHNAVLDAVVTLKKSWYDVTTAQEAYEKRKNNLSSYLPGAIFIMENQRVLLPGNIEALSMTYKNPSDLKVSREIMFVHRGAAYEFVFQAKEENFTTVKEDFRYILENMKLY